MNSVVCSMYSVRFSFPAGLIAVVDRFFRLLASSASSSGDPSFMYRGSSRVPRYLPHVGMRMATSPRLRSDLPPYKSLCSMSVVEMISLHTDIDLVGMLECLAA